MRVKIFSAGSIGNHLAQASRRKGWEVVLTDIDRSALERTKNEIYPARYGQWDPGIQLFTNDEAPKGGFDVIYVGTPPDVRMRVAIEALKEEPKVLQLEKPYYVPMIDENSIEENKLFLEELKRHNTKVVVGYEYALGDSAKKIASFITNPDLGEVRLLELEIREEWTGVFKAHPWLNGPQDTYLGFWQRGGGACGEHSHAIHYWQYFASLLGLGKINQVSADMRMINNGIVDYDELCYLNLTTDKGFKGRIVQDVVTDPPFLSMLIQRKKGFVKWLRRGVPGKGNVETITFGVKKEDGSWDVKEEEIAVKRPDDFYHEINHIEGILQGGIEADTSPISLESGLLATKVVTAAHNSRLNNNQTIKLN